MKSGVNVLQINNPHTKMEGVQKIRPQEIDKLLEKAKQQPIKIEGDFVKVQFYEFKADEFEEMDAPDKNKQAKKGNKDAKNMQNQKNKNNSQVKIQEKPKAKSTEDEEEIEADNQNDEEQQEEQQEEKQLKQHKNQMQEQDEAEEYDQELEKVQNNNDENDENDQIHNEEDEEPDQEEMNQVLQEYSESQKSDKQAIESNNVSAKLEQSNLTSSQVSVKKYKSGMAAMMEDLLNESQAASDEQIDEQESEQKLQEQEPLPQQDGQAVQNYLKIIKQYQIKLKQLNEQVSKQETLPMIQEEDQNLDEDNQEIEKYPRKHIYPGIGELNIYDEFKLPILVEEQVKQRILDIEAENYENEQKLRDKEELLRQMEVNHQLQVEEMKKQYESQIQGLKLTLEQMKYLEEQRQIKKNNESSIGLLIDSTERINLAKDPEFSLLNSNLQPSVDSNISNLLMDDSYLYQKHQQYRKQQEKPRMEKNIQNLVDSNIDGLITSQDAMEFKDQEIDSKLSISNLMGVDEALKLLNSNISDNSDIDQLINTQERIQFPKDPQYNDQTFPNSDIDSIENENSQLMRMIDSDIDNNDLILNKDGSYYKSLEQELDHKFQISKTNKLEAYKMIAEQAKQEYQKQVVKLKNKNSKHIRVRNFRDTNSEIDSSIGSLALEKAPDGISSNVSEDSSLIGSLIDQSEKEQFMKQSNLSSEVQSSFSMGIESNESSINSLISKNEQNLMKKDLQQMNSSISSYNSLQDSESQLLDSRITDLLAEQQQIDNSEFEFSKDNSKDKKSDVSLSYISHNSHNSSKGSIKSLLHMKQMAMKKFQ